MNSLKRGENSLLVTLLVARGNDTHRSEYLIECHPEGNAEYTRYPSVAGLPVQITTLDMAIMALWMSANPVGRESIIVFW